MTDDSAVATTQAIYHSSMTQPWDLRGERSDEMDPLFDALRERKDGGRPFWERVAAVLRDTDEAPEQVPPLVPVIPAAGDPVVYYMRFADRVKIGTTTNLSERLKAIPHDELLAIEAGGYKVESHRHREFRALRVIGEWFRYEEPLASHIAALRA